MGWRKPEIGRTIKENIKRAAFVGAVDAAASVVTQKESILGKAIDISSKYLGGDNNDEPPTAGTGEGGVGAGGGLSAEDVSEFLMGNPALTAFLAYLLIQQVVQSRSQREFHSA